MSLELGTNCGLVASSPSADPDGTSGNADDRSWAQKITTPAYAITVTELGWYQNNTGVGTEGWEMAIYTHDAVNDVPESIVGSRVTGNFSSGVAGWYSGACSIELAASTVYWIAMQADDGVADIDYGEIAGTRRVIDTGANTELNDPYPDAPTVVADDSACAVYAVYEAAVGGPTPVAIIMQMH